MRLRFLSKKGQKAGVHVGTMTQHLSRLQPERCLCSRPRSLLPPKHEFYFQVQSRAAGWAGAEAEAGARARAGLRVANGGRSLPSSLLSRLLLGARSRRRPLGRAGPREPAGHSAPGRGVVTEAVLGAAGLGASRAVAPALASAGRGG